MKEAESDEANDFMVECPCGATASAFFSSWSRDGVLPLSELLMASVAVEAATDLAHDFNVEGSLFKPCKAAVGTLLFSWSTSDDVLPLPKLLTASVTVEAVTDAATDFWKGSLFGSFAAESGTTLAVAVGGEAGGVG